MITAEETSITDLTLQSNYNPVLNPCLPPHPPGNPSILPMV